jgi:streptogramin lyase
LRATVGGKPCGVAGAAGAVWISNADTGQLLRLDPATGTVTRRIALDPTPCAITVAYGSLWVVTQSGKLDRVDPVAGRVLAHVPIGETSYQAVATPGAMWVSNRNGATLTRIDPATNRVTATVPTPGIQPGGMVYAAGSLWVGDDTDGADHVLRMNPATHAFTRLVAGHRPAYLTATPGAIWVSNVNDGTVSRLDAASGRQTTSVKAGASPVNLDVRPGAAPEVWVPDDTGGHVTRVDATAGTVVETIDATGKGPALLAAVGGDIWVTMYEAGEVWRITPAAR